MTQHDAATLDAHLVDPPDGNFPDVPDADSPDAAEEPPFDPTNPPPPPTPCQGPPDLYQPNSCTVLADGIREYTPEYQLWSDGADKRRFVFLPANGRIDTANPDRWKFPVGTRFYKEFKQGELKIETRLIKKVREDLAGIANWSLESFKWSPDQLSVVPANPMGESDVLATRHDIPSQQQCGSCHTMTRLDAINGFGALQLNHLAAGFSLTELLDRGLLFNSTGGPVPTVADSHFPGDAPAQNALGYLHANCGHCHGGPNPRGARSNPMEDPLVSGLQLWTTVATTDLSDSPLFRTGLCACLRRWTGREYPAGPYTRRFVPGHSELSAIVGRMSVRTGMERTPPLMPVPSGEQMPLLGTEVVDVAGLLTVTNFFDSLDMGTCDPTLESALPPPTPPAMSAM